MQAKPAAALVFTATLFLTGAGARAEVYTYTVDPLRSELQLSGRIAGIDAEPQTPGSDTTRYSGSLLADVTATTIQFVEGSVLDAQVQPLAQQPGNNGNAGSAPADYGFSADQFGGIDMNRVALRNLLLDMRSGVLTRSGTSVPTGQELLVDSGDLDYRFQGFVTDSRRESQRGEFALNNAGPGTITTVGSIETLTIPVNATFFFYTFDNRDTPLTATGQIVATRVIPEPGTAGVVAAIAGVAGMLRRRKAYRV